MAEKTDDYKKNIEEQERILQRIQQVIRQTYGLVLSVHGVKTGIANQTPDFFFSKNDSVNKSVNALLQDMARQVNGLLLSGVERSWQAGNTAFNKKMRAKLGRTTKELKELDTTREESTDAHRAKTAQSFYNEKRSGLNISDRVWNLAGNSKKELEIIIQNGIKEGKSAEDVQKSLKKYLNEPDALFKKVKNKDTGELEYSKAAKEYHPGQGVYKSAYKNAMRLARTEINAAYRQSEWESYQNNPLVIGYRIVLSNNHTTLKNGKPVPFRDICDDMAGVYPKWFNWTGWHPQCRCRMEPITISDSDFAARMKARANGTLAQWKPKDNITTPPKGFMEWVENNKARAKNWASTPYFIKDNFKGGLLSNGLKELMFAKNNIPNLVY